jgi:hypothetical protein
VLLNNNSFILKSQLSMRSSRRRAARQYIKKKRGKRPRTDSTTHTQTHTHTPNPTYPETTSGAGAGTERLSADRHPNTKTEKN